MVAAKRRQTMITGRETILGNIRKSLNRGPLSAERAAGPERRLKAAKPNLVPARGQGGHEALVQRFQEMAVAAACTVVLSSRTA